jgi:Xaa-Pro dipeptidase
LSPVLLDRLYRAHVQELETRAARVLLAQGFDALVVHSGSPAKRSRYDDQYWPLRACPHFLYWVPLPHADCALIVRPGSRSKVLRPVVTNFWEKPSPLETESFAEELDVVMMRNTTDAERRSHVGGGRVAFIGEDRAIARAWGIADEDACPPGLLREFDALRAVKTPYEVACIAEANLRATAGHEALRAAFAAGDASELDLHLLYLKATAQDDSDTPYKNIVALGAHAATLHHVAYGRLRNARGAESLLVDAGATCRGYGSDITRTWTKGSGAAATTFAQLVAEIDQLQRRLCAAVRTGTAFEALHDESHREVANVLCGVGIVRGTPEEALASGATRAFYPHGLGHSLGLQTHDVGCGLRPPRGDNPFLRNTADTAPGHVITIEPGVYFIDSLLEELRATPHGSIVDWRLVDALAPLGGVRVEDDIHVLDDGIRNLTREHLPLGGGRA